MKKIALFFFSCLFYAANLSADEVFRFYPANHQFIQYTGRIDFSTPEKPKFWASGAYIKAKFTGSFFMLKLNDELMWGKINNYLTIKIDNQPAYRIQLKGKANHITLAKNLSKGAHTILIAKATEFENGYIEFLGVTCERLLNLPPKPLRKIEFIGDSITCGAASDESSTKCGDGEWHDQHNAYLAYGPTTARSLNAQWHLSSVSGIGLMHSCCDKKTIMPQIFDKVNMARDSIKWDFNRYQPDVVTVCLGQNDGIQDSTQFTRAYVAFAKTLRVYYPESKLIFLTSPMANTGLDIVLKKHITALAKNLKDNGDQNIGTYFFKKQYNKGCGSHPSVEEHKEIGAELTSYLQKTMNW